MAVNDVSGDVGLMELQLTRPKVTLWIRPDIAAAHWRQLDEQLLAEPPPPTPTAASGTTGISAGAGPVNQRSLEPAAECVGHVVADDPEAGEHAGDSPHLAGPRCACVGLEDEEPQMFVRWTACALIFGWVSLLPVLFMQPHEERPRQQMFRKNLLKPCYFVMPAWILIWLLNTLELIFQVQIMPPFVFFGVGHMVLPAILAWYMLKMQAADEQLVLDQRASRSAEAANGTPVAVEDPAPTLLKELIAINPVALVWVGACASIPLFFSSLLTPMATERGKLAQGFVNLVYAPLIIVQLAFAWVCWHMRFIELPKMYLMGFGLLMSVPCFAIWCMCLACSSRYGRQDVELVKRQRLERGRAAAAGRAGPLAAPGPEAGTQEEQGTTFVDCTESQNRQWELIFMA